MLLHCWKIQNILQNSHALLPHAIEHHKVWTLLLCLQHSLKQRRTWQNRPEAGDCVLQWDFEMLRVREPAINMNVKCL